MGAALHRSGVPSAGRLDTGVWFRLSDTQPLRNQPGVWFRLSDTQRLLYRYVVQTLRYPASPIQVCGSGSQIPSVSYTGVWFRLSDTQHLLYRCVVQALRYPASPNPARLPPHFTACKAQLSLTVRESTCSCR